jgi:hypothetical protein
MLRRLKPQISPMDDLGARLEALLRRYAAAIDQGQDEIANLVDEFRAGLRELVTEFGQPAIDAAINELQDDASPSGSLH